MATAGTFGRAIPPVLSTVSLRGLGSALVSGLGHRGGRRQDLSEALQTLFNAPDAILTDSGTSALMLALRLSTRQNSATATGELRCVALPAFGCSDLVTAAVGAGVGIRLYDLDPRTLSPDPYSVRAVLDRGVDAIVLAHLFGFPAGGEDVLGMARDSGAIVVEDAAQGAGGTLDGRLLGSLGPLTVLSFGRGKGITGGGGGALLIRDEEMSGAAAEMVLPLASGTQWKGLSAALVQRMVGRPRLYWIPASIPSLQLGEMVFKSPVEPMSMGIGNAALARDAVTRLTSEAEERGMVARAILRLDVWKGEAFGPCESVTGGIPGYLRFPALLPGWVPSPALGVLRAYPMTLPEMPTIRTQLLPGETAGPGAELLSQSLLTIPTHHRVGRDDIPRFRRWAEENFRS